MERMLLPPNFVWLAMLRGGRVTEANRVRGARPPPADIGLAALSATSPSFAGGGDMHASMERMSLPPNFVWLAMLREGPRYRSKPGS